MECGMKTKPRVNQLSCISTARLAERSKIKRIRLVWPQGLQCSQESSFHKRIFNRIWTQFTSISEQYFRGEG